MLFCENASKSSERNEGVVKNFYGESSLFIGARGYFKKTASI
jgi:hypothetical protein